MKRIYLIFLGILISMYAICQNVKNQDFYQSGSNIIITYDLDKEANISVYLSMDGGRNFGPALKKVKGSVGKNVMPGKNLSITWDVLSEIEELEGDDIVFQIKASAPSVKSRVLIDAVAGMNIASLSPFNPETISYGLMVGWAKRVGLYGKFRSNFQFVNSARTEINENYIFTTGNSKLSEINFTTGILIGCTKSYYLYLGIGYGSRDFYAEDINKSMVKLTDYSISGASVDLGMMFFMGKFSLSIGANAIVGKGFYLVPELGLGVMF